MSLRSIRATGYVRPPPPRRQSRHQLVDRDQRAARWPRRACADLHLELQQITRCPQQPDRVIVEMAQSKITVVTKQTAQFATLMTMIDARRTLELLVTDCTAAALLGED